MTLLALLIFAHLLLDYPLQGDFLSKAKNPNAPIPGVPWYQAMAAHGAMQGLAVGLLTGSVVLGLLEFVIHSITDLAKCDGRIGFNTDQAIHMGCKVVWAAVIVYG